MAKYTKETTLYRKSELHDALDKAGSEATNYVTDITGGGISVHQAGSTADAVKIDGDSVDIVHGGKTVASYGETAVIGEKSDVHAEISSSSFEIGDGSEMFAFIGQKPGITWDGFETDGTKKVFTLSHTVDPSTTPTVSGGNAELLSYTAEGKTLTFGKAPGSYFTVTYKTTDPIKYYTFGSGANVARGEYSFLDSCPPTTKSLTRDTGAAGYASHAEAEGCASGAYAHAESAGTAAGEYSHAEGTYTAANGNNSHAENAFTSAYAPASHAEGLYTTASGDGSHAEGHSTTAKGEASHAGGYYTEAQGNFQTVIGKFNSPNNTDLFQIGNGDESNNRSNAFTVDKSGNVTASGAMTATSGTFSGNVYINGTPHINKTPTRTDPTTFTGTAYVDGFLTNASKGLRFTIPYCPAIYGTPTSITASMKIRQNGKYIYGSASASNTVTIGSDSFSVSPLGVSVVYNLSTALSGATNNDLIAIDGRFTFNY